MSNLLKKVTSAVAGLAIVFSVVSPIAGVSAAYSSLEAANRLAQLGVIVDQSSNPADYRLGDNLSRREQVKVAMNLASFNGVEVSNTCNGAYSDLDSSDFGCKYAESALANGFIASNAMFNPGRNVSKAEALKMIMNALGINKAVNDSPAWQDDYVDAAVEAGVLASAFTDYDTPATRGWIFMAGAEALDFSQMDDEDMMDEDEDDLLSDLLDGLEDDEDEMDEEEMDETDDTPVVLDGTLRVALADSSPSAQTIPAGANGIMVAAYEFTAGSADVTINQISVKRAGLSDADTIESIALFTENGRVSNAKSDNQDNDTVAQINLNNGGLVMQAGETKTIMVVVDIPRNGTGVGEEDVEGDQFAVRISDIRASAEVTGVPTANSATMTVGSINAPLLTIDTSGSVSDPTLGEQQADIFEFEVDNSSDEDIILRSITFEGSSDAEDDLVNFELRRGNDTIATTDMMSGDYLTFDLGDGITIEEDENEDFTVRADIIDGAGDTIEFRVDERLDVTADSTTFGFGASINIDNVDSFGDLGSVTIEAGEVTFIEIESDLEEIREDKDNVDLAMFRITNVSGEQLELQEFGVTIEVDNGGASTVNGNALTVTNLFDEIELYNEDNGSSYELDDGTVTTVGNVTTAVFSDNNIDVFLGEGTTTWSIRGDTAEDIANFDSTDIDISIDISGDVKIVETQDDREVTDKTPSSLSFNTIEGSESGADVSLIPLADVDVVRGANDVLALSFEIEAEEVSEVVVEEITVSIDANGAAATNQQISAVKLYEGSVSASNLLDEVSGSDIGTGGDVSFDDMDDILISANDEQVFVVSLTFVDGVDAVNGSDYTVSVTAIDMEDDEGDDIDVSGQLPLASNRQITVNPAGTIQTLAYDDANSDNEFDKLALAGDNVVIASFDVRSDNEIVESEEVSFTIAGATGVLRNSLTNASLLLNGEVIATNKNSNISNTTILFEDVAGLDIPTTTSELALRLNTANIGDEFIGEPQQDLQVTGVTLADNRGTDSGKDVADRTLTFAGSRLLDIVPAIVTPAVVSTFGTDDITAELRLVTDGGDNTDNTGDAVQADLDQLVISVSSFQGAAGTITVFNGNDAQIGTAAVTANGDITIDVTDDAIGNDNEVYRLETTGEANYRLAKMGVVYLVDGVQYTTELRNSLVLGQYADSN